MLKNIVLRSKIRKENLRRDTESRFRDKGLASQRKPEDKKKAKIG